jgi:hypothetical protein
VVDGGAYATHAMAFASQSNQTFDSLALMGQVFVAEQNAIGKGQKRDQCPSRVDEIIQRNAIQFV